MGRPFDIDLTEYVPFEHVSDHDLQRARIFNKCRMSETGCWIWTGAKGSGGYGVFNLRSLDQRAHRASYMIFKGEIPEGLHVLHRCDNPACVNPAHLRVGTVKENMAEREARGRRDVRGEKIGTAKLTAQAVVEIKSSSLASQVLADKYGVSSNQIWRIRTGKSWGHVVAPVEKVDGR